MGTAVKYMYTYNVDIRARDDMSEFGILLVPCPKVVTSYNKALSWGNKLGVLKYTNNWSHHKLRSQVD